MGGLVAPATVVGAALGFGAQQVVQDLLAGFFIIVEKQYGFGDLVALTVAGIAAEARGTVEDVTLRVTKLRSTDGEVFTIPNGQIVKSINLSKDWARAVVDIPVSTSADLNRVNEVLHQECEHARDNPVLGELLLDAPTVMGVESIEVDTVTLRMVARTLPGKQFEAGRQLRVLVLRALARAGIVTAADATVGVVDDPAVPAAEPPKAADDENPGAGAAAVKLTLNILEKRSEDEDRRWPSYLFGGRIRTSTLVLIVAFLAVWWVYDTYRPHEPAPQAHRPPQVVPPGFVPDPNYTWVPRSRVQEPRPPTVTPTPTTTPPTPTTDRPQPTTTPPPPFQLPTPPCCCRHPPARQRPARSPSPLAATAAGARVRCPTSAPARPLIFA